MRRGDTLEIGVPRPPHPPHGIASVLWRIHPAAGADPGDLHAAAAARTQAGDTAPPVTSRRPPPFSPSRTIWPLAALLLVLPANSSAQGGAVEAKTSTRSPTDAAAAPADPTAAPLSPCPLGEELQAGGRWLDPGALDGLVARVAALAPGVCGDELARSIVEENGPTFVGAMLEATESWPAEVAEPWLIDLWAASWFYRGGRREDALTYSTEALASRLGERDLVARIRAGDAAVDWPQRAHDKYLVDWSAGLDRAAPPFDASAQGEARRLWLACIDDPSTAPPDPFDPLGTRGGLLGSLGLVARCASQAVLTGWRRSPDADWQTAVESMLRQYSVADSAVNELNQGLERGWGQGQGAGTGQPLQPPVGTSPPDPLRLAALAYALLLGVALALSGPRRTRRMGFPLLAVAFGLGLLGVAEGLLRLAGAGDGGALRPGPPLDLPSIVDNGPEHWLRDQRGRPFSTRKRPGVVRVAVVGASSVAGPGLSWPESLPGQLTRQWQAAVPCIEVLNLGYHGADSSAFRSYALAAVQELSADAVVLYGGHNEVAGTREAHRYLDLDAGSIRRREALGRLALWGLLFDRLGDERQPVALDPEQIEAAQTGLDHDYRTHNPSFEATVDARAAREFGDLARGLRRLGTPLVVAIPSFNHHGLRVGRPGDEALGTRLQRAGDALLTGDVERGLAEAEQLTLDAPGHAAPWNLLALAREAAGDLAGAEDAIWQTSRRNHLGSAVTPGVVDALRRAVAEHGVLADAHGALHVAAGPHLPGYDLFVDYVHLNPRGVEVVAAEIVRASTEAGLVDGWAGRCGDR